MKRLFYLILIFLCTAILLSCGGGGTGIDLPPVTQSDKIELRADSHIAQIPASITLEATVSSKGRAVSNAEVTFTIPFGEGNFCNDINKATTDSSGKAKVCISSTTPGFSTVQAEVNTGSGQVRDQKDVFFTSNDVLAVTMSMDVDSVPGNGLYDEASDFILFEPPPSPDDTVEVLATVFDAGGEPLVGESVIWNADQTEAIFLRTETTTNVNGQAKAVVQVTPESIRNTETHVNIMAYAGNGAANMVSLFLQPVTVSASSSLFSANPTAVNPGGTSALTAVVKLSTGAVAPDGTTVNFTTTCGTVTPFAQTTDGVAAGTFTAPSTLGTCTVTGTVGGVTIGSANILVTTALNVLPPTRTITNPVVTDHAGYTISGGVAPYSAISSHPSLVSVAVTGTTLTATVDVVPATDTTVTITVSDNVGATKTVTLILDVPAVVPLTVSPTTQTISCSLAAGFHFSVSGGTPAYTITSLNPALVTVTDATGFTAKPAAAGCAAFPPAPSSTPVNITVQDNATPSVMVTVTLTVTNP